MRTQTLTKLLGLAVLAAMTLGFSCGQGLSMQAFDELHDAGVDKYVGQFTPSSSTPVANGWVRHDFDPDGGNGPICIAGTQYSVWTKTRNPKKVLIFEQGGGACWQDFYFCNVLATDQDPSLIPDGFEPGIFGQSYDTGTEVIQNPLKDWSIVYMPYCDGSVHSGDNDVVDPNFPFGPVRFHRGLRNMTAGMDVAGSLYPNAKKVLLAGSSAGGVGVAGFSPFVARFVFGNGVKLSVFNDAGPVHVNLNETAAIQARADDWQFGQFYPASCTDCDPLGKATAPIIWRLANDRSIREAFYSTDGDETNRFFLNVPTQADYRQLVIEQHDEIRAANPLRYKRFIKSGSDTHTALQDNELYYTEEVHGIALVDWTKNFVKRRFGWFDLVEDFIPLP